MAPGRPGMVSRSSCTQPAWSRSGRRQSRRSRRRRCVTLDAATARTGMRRIWSTGDTELEAAVFDGPALVPGMTLAGPALIDDVDTTLYVPEGVEVEIDRFSNYVFQLGETAATSRRAGARWTRPHDGGARVSATTSYDPVLAQVIQRRLEVVCQEAAITLNRTSGSPIVTEGNDFSTSLIAPDGEIIAFSSYLPVHFVSSMNAIRDLLATIDLSTVEAGDHFAANDPNTTAPLHSADPNVLTPIFVGRRDRRLGVQHRARLRHRRSHARRLDSRLLRPLRRRVDLPARQDRQQGHLGRQLRQDLHGQRPRAAVVQRSPQLRRRQQHGHRPLRGGHRPLRGRDRPRVRSDEHPAHRGAGSAPDRRAPGRLVHRPSTGSSTTGTATTDCTGSR